MLGGVIPAVLRMVELIAREIYSTVAIAGADLGLFGAGASITVGVGILLIDATSACSHHTS